MLLVINSLVLQYGWLAGVNGDTTMSFPITYKTTVAITIGKKYYENSGANASFGWVSKSFCLRDSSLTGFTYNMGNIYWIAIGY